MARRSMDAPDGHPGRRPPARLKYPLLVWEDHDGAFTARTLDGPAAAVGASARKAIDQVKRFLDGVRKSCGELEAPDFADAELCFFSVSVRSAYEVGPGVRNYDKPLAMRLPAVVGRCADGSFSCVLPTLDARFRCESRKSVEPTAKDVARQRLEGLEPRELSRFLPAKSYRLEAGFVPRERRRREGRGPGLPILRRTAEPLAGPFMRRTVGGVWRRADEIAAVAERLRQRECTRLLLVGEGGVGKTAVLVAAVRRLELESSSDAADPPGERVTVRDRFWLTSGARIVGGMRYLGQWQERCQAMIGELDGVYGALCIDNLLGLIRAGGSDPSSSVAAFLAPYLERGELRMVAEATPAELDACRRLLPGFAALFQIVRIEPFGLDAARVVLREAAGRAGRVACAPGVPDTVRHLFRRFMPYQPFPGRSVRFVRALFRDVAREGPPEVTADHVVAAFVRQTGLPEFLLRDERPLDPDDVRRHVEGRIRGQPAACDAVVRLVIPFKAGLNDPRRSLGVMLFCGPTGVGKTALVKVLAD